MTVKFYRNPSEGRVEWDGYRDFELFLQVAQEVGLWVIARPGLVSLLSLLFSLALSTDLWAFGRPYINGESSGTFRRLC